MLQVRVAVVHAVGEKRKLLVLRWSRLAYFNGVVEGTVDVVLNNFLSVLAWLTPWCLSRRRFFAKCRSRPWLLFICPINACVSGKRVCCFHYTSLNLCDDVFVSLARWVTDLSLFKAVTVSLLLWIALHFVKICRLLLFFRCHHTGDLELRGSEDWALEGLGDELALVEKLPFRTGMSRIAIDWMPQHLLVFATLFAVVVVFYLPVKLAAVRTFFNLVILVIWM